MSTICDTKSDESIASVTLLYTYDTRRYLNRQREKERAAYIPYMAVT